MKGYCIMKREMKDKLNALTSDKRTTWKEKAQGRMQNEAWLNKSAEIALKILRELRVQSITQKDLAEKMNVSAQYINKLLKGGENLSLETISRLESVLNITLITVPDNSINMALKMNCTSEYFQLKEYKYSGEYKYEATVSDGYCYEHSECENKIGA
jgi:transcriptional regulator with XRE-family HTH domain